MQPLVTTNNLIKIDGFHNIYYFEFDKNHFHPLEKHSFWEMVYVDMGEIVASTEGEVLTLKDGQVIFRAPGEMHAHTSDSKVPNNLLVVSFTCKSPCMEFFKSNRLFTLDKTAKTLLSLFIGEAKNALGSIPYHFKDQSPLEFTDNVFGASQLMEAHFTEFLIKLIRNKSDTVSQEFDQMRDETELKKSELIVNYLNEHIYDNITLNHICDKFFLRKSRLCTVFKEHTGESPMKYFAELKIREAKKLLRDGELTVSEISYKLNFSDIYSFSRAFKNATGFSPSKYKKSISNKGN